MALSFGSIEVISSQTLSFIASISLYLAKLNKINLAQPWHSPFKLDLVYNCSLYRLWFLGYGHITPKTHLGQGITIIISIIGIPIAMLAFKTSGELLAASFRFLVIKTETVMLKKAEPKHVKKKTFSVATALMVVLVILSALSSTYFEDWTFMEGLYAWFITFTTIGFGDYVQFESHARKVAQGESPKTSLLVHGIIFAVPYVVGLSLMSCILNCLVDSVDHIRNFRDRCMNCCLGFISPIRRLFCRTSSSYDLAAEEPSHEQNELSSV